MRHSQGGGTGSMRNLALAINNTGDRLKKTSKRQREFGYYPFNSKRRHLLEIEMNT